GEAQEQVASRHPDCGDGPVVGAIGFEIEAQHARSRDATQSALAASELGPAVADGEEERGQSEREQGEIDAAPPQDQRTGEERARRNKDDREQERQNDRAREPVPLAQGGSISSQSEPCSV